MVNALHEKYQETPDENLFAELPLDIQELLIESRVQAREEKTRTHQEVMTDLRKKYRISD